MDDSDREMSTRISKSATRLFVMVMVCSRAFAEWNMATEFRIVRVPVAAGLEIVEQFSDERTTPDAINTLARLFQKGEATVVTEVFGKGVSGVLQTIEHIEEHRYPTEFEAPNPQLAPQATSGLAIPAVRTVMDVKNTGTALQHEMEVSADGLILAGVVMCKNWRHIGDLRYEYGVRADGLKYYVEQPKFLTHGTSANVVVASGVPYLTGAFLAVDAPGQMELHIVTMKTAQIGASASLEGEKEVKQCSRMDVRRYRLSVEDGTRARIAITIEKKDPSEVLSTMIRDGNAMLSLCASLPSVPYQQNVQENIVEIRYPTEFEPPGRVLALMDTVTRQRELRIATARARKIISGFHGPPQPYSSPFNLPTVPPTTFEVRNTGSTIQSESGSVGASDPSVMLNLSIQAVGGSGFTRRLKAVEPQGERIYDYQPKFITQKTTENRALPVGKWVLQAFHKRPAPFNDIEITIVRIKTNHVQFTHQKP